MKNVQNMWFPHRFSILDKNIQLEGVPDLLAPHGQFSWPRPFVVQLFWNFLFLRAFLCIFALPAGTWNDPASLWLISVPPYPPLYLFSTSRFLQKDFAGLFYNQKTIEKWYHIIPRSPGHCLMSVWKKTSVTFPNKWSDFSSLEFWAEILAFDTHLRHKKYVFISVPWEHFWTLSMTITKPGDEQKYQK